MSNDRPVSAVSEAVETSRLRLRPFQEDDFKAVRSYLADPQVMRFVDDTYSEKQVRRFLSRWVGDDPPVLALVRKSKDRVVGHVVFHRYEHPDVYEISCVLHAKYHRRGYASEIGRALLDHAFRDLRAHRVFAITLEGNTAAGRLVSSLGMTQEAALRKATQLDGTWVDEYHFAMLEGDPSAPRR
ncbi:GNAT family N-acetyltransferase [Arsenicicoccus dermatophilus]|uniref:GNAT family N-acetyltransferase n=1 Tax=Arsenicicoccus dermatophilus TaxID=1076331 RepID=UPI0039176444